MNTTFFPSTTTEQPNVPGQRMCNISIGKKQYYTPYREEFQKVKSNYIADFIGAILFPILFVVCLICVIGYKQPECGAGVVCFGFLSFLYIIVAQGNMKIIKNKTTDCVPTNIGGEYTWWF